MTDEGYGYEHDAPFYEIFGSLPNPDFFRAFAAGSDLVLDVGAGSGRAALVMAEAGADVIAVEPSAAMLDLFEQKLADAPSRRDRIEIRPATASAFDCDRDADAAVMRGVFDHFLGHEERVAALRNVAAHLRPGGSLVFDATVYDFESSDLAKIGSVERDGRRYDRHLALTVLDDRVEKRYVNRVFEDGELIEETEQTAVNARLDPSDVRSAVEDAGLTVDAEWSDYERTPFHDGDARLVVEAVA